MGLGCTGSASINVVVYQVCTREDLAWLNKDVVKGNAEITELLLPMRGHFWIDANVREVAQVD